MLNHRFKYIYCAATVALLFLAPEKASQASDKHSPALSGFIGLNTIPSARMDSVGTIHAGISTLDPYISGYIGAQLASPLYINIRQTAEISSLTGTAKRLYPNIGMKLRLRKESAYSPEISVGLQSIIGHSRMASEYIALSKSYKNLDFTAGMGWGRMGASGKFNNPLKYISKHFGKDREQNSELPNAPANWLTGDSIGFFGGVEYFTPYQGLSIKLDYGSDKYSVEQATSDYNPASPWGIGLSYNYKNWANASLGMQGSDKIFAGLSIKSNPAKWSLTHRKYDNPKPFYKTRSHIDTNITAIKQDAQSDGAQLYNITESGNKIFANLELSPKAPAPQQIGRAARHISMHSAQNIEEINIRPSHENLYGANIKLMRPDVEKAVDNKNGSPQELWKNADFVVSDSENKPSHSFLSTKWISGKKSFSIDLENQLSLSEEDSGILYRSSAIINAKSSTFLGILIGNSIRININDNLDKIEKLRPPAQNPVRSDIYNFTQKRIGVENSYIAYNHSFSPQLHANITAGYLEEFYAGYGGELLYRPFGSRIALGANIWNVVRRNPYTPLNLGLEGNAIISGHVNGWYDLSHQNMVLSAKAGRFLGGDTGISLGLEKIFKNGAKLNANTTLSNYSEPDLFGGTTSAYHNISLSLPLGSIKYIPEGSKIITKIAPFGRDIGQILNPPSRLFDATENMTLDHMANHWIEVMD